MTDEINKNLENEELELEQNKELDPEKLEGVSGGLIVNGGFWRNARVVDDKTGEILNSDCYYAKDAKKVAERLNVSTEVISMAEYKERFGKDI